MPNEQEELDAAIDEAVALCKQLTAFDLAELKVGRITLAAARFEAAFAEVQAIGGIGAGGLDEENKD
ncbi:hypothetical protein ANOBCDAF_04358 [Pleomorphomonas sp. T1.2MG-36]|uniref:hypothetical protein n=1 Tax=Pleomorphomonas sp. T1.2MG-36 TaxID=3041167 RepID=UPI0024774E3C|nr:hypothetical protein [Pleomorphomonas sp. T1.2MG-36]CAI9418748.1 hypothetical protein ANOBCDAF_04358 [Pleomorphomonas sp. T1.2MG-36]